MLQPSGIDAVILNCICIYNNFTFSNPEQSLYIANWTSSGSELTSSGTSHIVYNSSPVLQIPDGGFIRQFSPLVLNRRTIPGPVPDCTGKRRTIGDFPWHLMCLFHSCQVSQQDTRSSVQTRSVEKEKKEWPAYLQIVPPSCKINASLINPGRRLCLKRYISIPDFSKIRLDDSPPEHH